MQFRRSNPVNMCLNLRSAYISHHQRKKTRIKIFQGNQTLGSLVNDLPGYATERILTKTQSRSFAVSFVSCHFSATKSGNSIHNGCNTRKIDRRPIVVFTSSFEMCMLHKLITKTNLSYLYLHNFLYVIYSRYKNKHSMVQFFFKNRYSEIYYRQQYSSVV